MIDTANAKSTAGSVRHNWSQLAQQPWDLVIVGGGITGAGVLREAARLGLKTLLVEQQDFAWGTSSRSSKMVHGGLRYLGQGDYKLTRHSLQERERLLTQLPRLVERMGYYFIMPQSKSPPGWAVKLLLWLYDRMAGIRDHQRVPLSTLKEKFQGIATQTLKDCFYYTDAVTDDARLVMRVLQEACDDGGHAINYVRAETLHTDSSNRITAVSLHNQLSGERLDIQTKSVVNATGAWADQLRHQLNPETRIRPLRGSHLVISQQRLPVACAITLLHPDDQRAMFVFPWENRTVIGTTDLDHQQPLDQEASITRAEVDYLLRAMNILFPQAALSEADIISTWSGVRPVIGSEKSKDPSRERRDHAVWRDANLVTVSGGKLTTFRLIALDVLKALGEALPLPASNTQAATFSAPPYEPERYPQCPTDIYEHLYARYGNRVAAILADSSTATLHPLGDTLFSVAECRWLLQQEAVVHLDDLMLRRTRLGHLFKQGAVELLPQLQQSCMQLLGWSEQRWLDEVERYQGIWRKHYFLPGTAVADC